MYIIYAYGFWQKQLALEHSIEVRKVRGNPNDFIWIQYEHTEINVYLHFSSFISY